MPTEEEKRKLELEIALRDSMSAGLRQIGRELDALNRKAHELSVVGSASFGQIAQNTTSLSVSVSRANRSMAEMGGTIRSIQDRLKGPLGLAALFSALRASPRQVWEEPDL